MSLVLAHQYVGILQALAHRLHDERQQPATRGSNKQRQLPTAPITHRLPQPRGQYASNCHAMSSLPHTPSIAAAMQHADKMPWHVSWQVNERNTVWLPNDSGLRLKLNLAADILQYTAEEAKDKTEALFILVPGIERSMHVLTPEQVASVLSDLVSVGEVMLALRCLLPDADIASIVSKAPQILLADAGTLPVHAQKLAEAFPAWQPSVAQLLTAVPSLLCQTLDELDAHLQSLQQLRQQHTDVSLDAMLMSYPPLLKRMGDLPAVCADVHAARELLGQHEHDVLIKRYPQLLAYYGVAKGGVVASLGHVSSLFFVKGSELCQLLMHDPFLLDGCQPTSATLGPSAMLDPTTGSMRD
eukprot:jgi/Chrzof1/8032/UNPLg00077.t1